MLHDQNSLNSENSSDLYNLSPIELKAKFSHSNSPLEEAPALNKENVKREEKDDDDEEDDDDDDEMMEKNRNEKENSKEKINGHISEQKNKFNQKKKFQSVQKTSNKNQKSEKDQIIPQPYCDNPITVLNVNVVPEKPKRIII